MSCNTDNPCGSTPLWIPPQPHARWRKASALGWKERPSKRITNRGVIDFSTQFCPFVLNLFLCADNFTTPVLPYYPAVTISFPQIHISDLDRNSKQESRIEPISALPSHLDKHLQALRPVSFCFLSIVRTAHCARSSPSVTDFSCPSCQLSTVQTVAYRQLWPQPRWRFRESSPSWEDLSIPTRPRRCREYGI